jgi:hypothetical protein
MHWAISVGSATDRKSFLKLYNSNITSLYLSNTIALIENSTIDHLDTHYLSEIESKIEILNSKIKAIKDVITLKTSLFIKNSTVGLIFTIFKPRGVIRLKGIHPGYFSYLNLGEHVEGAKLNAIFNNVNITGLTINVEEATLVLDNTHINISFNSNSSIIVLPNASLSIEDFALWDSNAKIIRQTMFKVVSSNETGVKEVNISINLNNTLLRKKIVTNNEGLAFVNLTFTRLNFSSYNSIFEAVALKITSDNSRLYGIRKFNMMMRQPIVVEVKRQYYVKVVSDKDKVKGEGWYDEGTLAMVGVLSSTVLENTGERLVFSGWSGDINSANTTVTFIVNGPKIIYANWKKQYYVNVCSKFSSFENGNDWYDKGSYVRLKLKETSLGFFVQKVFDHFEGLSSRDRVVGNGEVEIFVDGPRTIVAVWRTTTTATVVIIAAIVVAAFITAFLLFKKRSAR